MEEIIESIRKLLKEGVFSDEQHVRFSLVGRICEKLGWDIWNPAEFYTEYPVKKYPPQEITTELRGRVDVALFLADKRSEKAEVFIEVKSPGRLQNELQSGEAQLQRYNYWDKAAICILTDGITWRFYLPSEGGSFDSTLFNEFNILTDNVEIICQTLDKVLRRDNFRKQAVQNASDMYEELRKIRLIHKVKQKAIQIASDTGMDIYQIAKQLLIQTEHVDLDIEEIGLLWERTIPRGEPTSPLPPPSPPTDCVDTFISARGVKASGCYNIKTKRFTLYKGSEIVKLHTKSINRKYIALKETMIKSGKLVADPTSSKFILNEDTLFSTPSGASSFVLGRSSNGYTAWVDSKGHQLDQYRNRNK
jgi:predicted type IV restriction endonuclease